jgi:hypothetical protein
MRAVWQRLKYSVRSAVTAGLKALRPPITPMLILKVLLGLLLFFCGVIYGIWLIIRHRRTLPDLSG